MNTHINQLVKSLLQKESIEQCSLQELQSFADSNPYFGVAQLLLTKKIKAEKPDLYNEQLQKTFLYFHNPLWVEQLMNDTGNATIIAAPPTEATSVSSLPPAETKQPEAAVAIATSIEATFVTEVAITDAPAAEIIQLDAPISIIAEAAPSFVADEEIPPSIVAQTIALADVKENAGEPVKEELLFEPFHTVDYFASQGIKIRAEEKPTDKFGVQLKSFTDWLKILKKSPTTALTKNLTDGAEKKVSQMAEHSLTEKEVVTEAMAEVWAKQGNTQKAISLYTKLSLQEPAKSTYFAALIDELKKKL
jgi:hypothetical protein